MPPFNSTGVLWEEKGGPYQEWNHAVPNLCGDIREEMPPLWSTGVLWEEKGGPYHCVPIFRKPLHMRRP